MTLEQGPAHPIIPLGRVGTLRGTEYTVIGFLRRSVTYDNENFYWSEYLLYQPRLGFRWLIHSDTHWSIGEPLSPGAVNVQSNKLVWKGRTFKMFQQATATVRQVLGEFYWKVEVGERVYGRDFVDPPDMIAVETSKGHAEHGDADAADLFERSKPGKRKKKRSDEEMNVTRATYIPHEEVERAFGVRGLHKGWKVAPNQPSPVDNRVYLWWPAFAGLLLLLFVIFKAGVAPQVDTGIFWWSIVFVSVIPLGALFYGHAFERSRWKDSEFNPYGEE
jgi:hypothetical protein